MIRQRTRRAGQARAAAGRNRWRVRNSSSPATWCSSPSASSRTTPSWATLLPNRDRRGVPLLDQNLRTELPNVWAAGDYVVNPTNFISSIGEGKRVADLIDAAAARHQAEGQRDGDHPRSDRVHLDPEPARWPRASPSGR